MLGPRQVGKTTAIFQTLKKCPLPTHYATADDLVGNPQNWILEQWQVAKTLGTHGILVLDEIQKIPNWSETIKKLWDDQNRLTKKHLSLFLLGSSSFNLQQGLTESLTGRFEVVRFYHWNFNESKKLYPFTLQDYYKYGGYPGSYTLLKDPARWKSYLREAIIETVIGKDILSQRSVRNPILFRQAFEILCAYPAQEISYHKLLGQLQERGNVELIKHYIELYKYAFLLTELPKFSNKVHLKKASSPKILPLSPALVTYHYRDIDPGRLFEMAVGLELLRLPGELSYWREGNQEVDYILKTDHHLYAIEVKSGHKKGTKGLQFFCKQFPKARPIILSEDLFPHLSAKGLTFLKEME
ncbi:MAG: ATP-binding protein [Deltaproteobacteria bacterium]|nr:ATP-binding protein [Deltaproteobacteria bacterium]